MKNKKQGVFLREAITAKTKNVIIDVVGVIGWDVWYPEFKKMLEDIPETVETVTFDIYSPGGEIWEGNGIITEIGKLKQKTIANVQVAASMATLIAVACEDRIMASNGRWLVHNPWTLAIGDAEELETRAKELRDCEKEAIKFYASRTGKTQKEMKELMSEERWLTPEETKDFGFVQEINDPFDAQAFASVNAEIVASKNLPRSVIDEIAKLTKNEEPKEAEKNENANTDGSEGTGEGTGEKPEEPAENAGNKGGEETADVKQSAEYLLGKNDAQKDIIEKINELSKRIDESKEALDKRDELIKKLQSEKDKLTSENAAVKKALAEATERADKLTAGGLKFSPDVTSWEEALTACGGDYVQARKQHPDAFSEYRAAAKVKRNQK